MRGPYGFEVSDSCQACKHRASNFFCQLPPAALKDFNAIKSSSVYPEGAMLFLEKQEPRGIFILCEGQSEAFHQLRRRENADPSNRQSRRGARIDGGALPEHPMK